LQVDFEPQGIHLPEIGLWLDCVEECETGWISHAHSDHARGLHARVFGTEITLAIYGTRFAASEETAPDCCGVRFHEPWEFNGARLTAYPASHILGAAQLLIEYNGERLLYTGDIKYRPAICGHATEVVSCDRLIIESTFGLPIYRFLSREDARDRIVAFARECLEARILPAFVGYPLGRGQEIVHVLCEAGIPTSVHGSIARFLPIYEAHGFACPGWAPYKNGETAGKALVVVPGFRNYLEASGKNYRLAYVSGWAALDNARARAGAEELIPYSDHADFAELLTLVESSGAREVDVVHGYTELFAHILNQRGVVARAPRGTSARAVSDEVPEG
jgi:Cft2 family RNA processing exonuclease